MCSILYELCIGKTWYAKNRRTQNTEKIDKENSEGNSTTAGEYISLVLHII